MSRGATRYRGERQSRRGPSDQSPSQSLGRLPSEEREPQAKIVPFKPMNKAQAHYVECLNEHRLTFALGPAGTGKTYVAASIAAKMISDKEINHIILCRPAVEAEEHLGFLPGDLEEKLAPWVKPVITVLEERLGKRRVAGMVQAGMISVIPFAFMRGHTFKDCFVLLDEAQNTTPSQMKLFLTRIGENSTVSVNGDVTQSDIGSHDDHSGHNGLDTAIRLARKFDIPAGIVNFRSEDVVRSEQCRMWAEAFEAEDTMIDQTLPFLRAV